jgi:hypothetical protein
VCAWTPEGTIGDFFRTVIPYLPPPPSFVDPPLAWGDPGYVRELFEGTGLRIETDQESWTITHDSVPAAVACYTTTFGPVIQAWRLAHEAGRRDGLEADLDRLFQRLDTSERPGVTFPAQYLVVTGERLAAGASG